MKVTYMSDIRAVVYGVGAMNSIVAGMLLDKGVQIVGAIARSPQKVGQDLGDLLGLGRQLGVAVSDDAAEVLEQTHPDIAVIAVNSYLTDAVEQLRICAEHGVNAVTLSEEMLYPWETSPELSAELDALAKSTGATLTGTGYQDTFWVNMIALLMGTAHRIDTVRGKASWNVDDFGPELATAQQVGRTVAEFDEWVRGAQRPPTFGRNVLDALVADTGLTVKSITTATRPDIASAAMRSEALGIDLAPGDVIGFTDIDRIETEEGPVFEFEMSGRVYGPGEGDINEWTIEGEPNLFLSNGTVPTQTTTCTQMVNRIPDVIAAPPGIVTVDRLPRLRYRPQF
ncbi:dihydrodipicolinate reductase [Mycolicibacterium smegmatis]|uniref:Dihydrodipicolinate reductase, N-terminus domain protein n=2 Tax=Mycolicibacterium smegmatis TaxID=1772 RepID=A0QXI7_MYCS2|nr:dihydrodipicolinate reductase, N-terminus domain protein [Mycolicibacterium smegmatis MC2 155]TBM38423.1 dihydrodipicolinate reductase [Mycolicibacterium smegmatis]TBH44800.1 dihydrodipicolinate reductase [Mycolicibacterium smegmatis MC2 155]TBM50074.1 dihydrodipicolinate reductase [Mycolicibacterium smegmatis]TBM61074.1 dihydrodipicolinate reductase [Mycolicibacterium smegmatis]